MLVVSLSFDVYGSDSVHSVTPHPTSWCWIREDVPVASVLFWQLFCGKFCEITTYMIVSVFYAIIVCHLKTQVSYSPDTIMKLLSNAVTTPDLKRSRKRTKRSRTAQVPLVQLYWSSSAGLWVQFNRSSSDRLVPWVWFWSRSAQADQCSWTIRTRAAQLVQPDQCNQTRGNRPGCTGLAVPVYGCACLIALVYLCRSGCVGDLPMATNFLCM